MFDKNNSAVQGTIASQMLQHCCMESGWFYLGPDVLKNGNGDQRPFELRLAFPENGELRLSLHYYLGQVDDETGFRKAISFDGKAGGTEVWINGKVSYEIAMLLIAEDRKYSVRSWLNSGAGGSLILTHGEGEDFLGLAVRLKTGTKDGKDSPLYLDEFDPVSASGFRTEQRYSTVVSKSPFDFLKGIKRPEVEAPVKEPAAVGGSGSSAQATGESIDDDIM